MKKIRLQKYLAGLITTTSLCAFVYLNFLALPLGNPHQKGNVLPGSEVQIKEEDNEKQPVAAPYISGMVRIFQVVKRFVPSTH